MVRHRPKEQCEIEGCGISDPALLHRHHIAERTQLDTSNDDFNLAVLCSNHHNLVHSGRLEIIGVFPGTKPPTGRILAYKIDGVPNIPGLEEPYYTHQPEAMKVFYKDKK